MRRTLVRASFVLAAVSALGGLPLVVLEGPVGILFAADGLLDAAIWVAIAILARRVARPRLVPLSALCFLLMLPGALLTMTIFPAQRTVTVSYLAVIPLAVALVVPWSSRVHALWAVGYVGIIGAYAISPASGSLTADDRSALVVAVGLTAAASTVGYSISHGYRAREFAEHLRLRGLNKRLQATSADLERANVELRATLARLRRFEGLLPICAGCKSIRDEDGEWLQLEQYVSEHSEATFSHGLCPDCVIRLYPELADGALPA